jgi:uncharacterized protein
MPRQLEDVLETLRLHKDELRRRGVAHAAVFGSVARGEATDASDLDVLVDLDPDQRISYFDYAGIVLHIETLLGHDVDVANKKTLKPLLRDNILREAIDAF